MNSKIMKISRLRPGTDGRGITTLVLLHGCHMRCRYCINDGCYKDDTHKVEMSESELLRIVELDNLYFQSTGGGITFGGGEPLREYRFLESFCHLAKAEYPEWTINVETSLNVPWGTIEGLLPYVSRWIIDIKTFDAEIYKEYTGIEPKFVEGNLKKLSERKDPKTEVIIRVPEIPGFSEGEEWEKNIDIAKQYSEAIDPFRYQII